MLATARLVEVYEGAITASRGYSLDDTGRVYSFWWMYSPGTLRLSVCRGTVVEAKQEGDTVSYRVFSFSGNNCWEDRLEERLSFILGLREDYSSFHRKALLDPLASCIPRQLRGFRLRATSPWAALLTAVSQQNASFKQGWGMLYKLYTRAGRRLQGPGWVYIEPPEPSPRLYEAARSSGYGYRAHTIAKLAMLASRLEEDNPELVEAARSVRGVGSYTYNLSRLLALKDYNALPLDRWLQRLAAEAYNVDLREAGKEIARRFEGWRGLLALAATICFDAEVLSRALERLRRGENMAGLRSPNPLDLWMHYKD